METNYPMEMDGYFKKMSRGLSRRGFYFPYAADPMLIIDPLNLEEYMITMGSVT